MLMLQSLEFPSKEKVYQVILNLNPNKRGHVSKWYTSLSKPSLFLCDEFWSVKLQSKFLFGYLEAVNNIDFWGFCKIFWKIWI